MDVKQYFKIETTSNKPKKGGFIMAKKGIRIQIKDLPRNQKISREEMKKTIGGFYFDFPYIGTTGPTGPGNFGIGTTGPTGPSGADKIGIGSTGPTSPKG